MNIDIQIAIRDALAAGGEMKAVARNFAVPFATVRKAALEGWPDIPSLLPEDGGAQASAAPDESAPPSPSPAPGPAASGNAATLAKLALVQAEHNPKLLIRETATIIHRHLLRLAVSGEMKMMEMVGAGKLIKDLLWIQQNTGAAKEEDLVIIERLQTMAENGDPQGIIDFYTEMATLYQGVTNPDLIAREDPEPEALA